MGTQRHVTSDGGGGGVADIWHIIHHKLSINEQANVIGHQLGYVTIFFFFFFLGGGGGWG